MCDRTQSCANMCDSCSSSNVFGWGSCDCGDGCSGGCGGTCQGTCVGNCGDGCYTSCGAGCNTGCGDSASINLYNLAMQELNKKILASDVNNIKNLIDFEVKRRSKTPSSVTIATPNRSKSTDINVLNTNLENNIGINISSTFSSRTKATRSSIEELQDAVEIAYNTTITGSK